MTARDLLQSLALSFANHVVNKIPSNIVRCGIYRSIYRMKIGKAAHIAMGVQVLSPWRITIGRNSVINSGCLLDGRAGLLIGDNVDISWQVMIFTLEHDHDDPNYATKPGPVSVGDRACLTTRAVILPGVAIGEGAVVAAGAVVTKDVAPFSVVAGVPARKIKDRARNMRYVLHGGRLFH